MFKSKLDKFSKKVIFSSRVKPGISQEKDKYLSLASIEKLKEYLPKDSDILNNPGFLPFCGNGFVANRANANGVGIRTEEAIKVAENSKYIFLDVEHVRSKVVGFITDVGYSEFGNDKPLSKEKILKDFANKPFNVVYSGIIWRITDLELSEYIEESGDPNSELFGEVSLSWEIGYVDSDIVLIPNNSKNLEDGKLIKDEKESSKLEKILKTYGGSGYTDDGQMVVNVIKGEILPIGFGLVSNPAADVKGILTKRDDDMKNDESKTKVIKIENAGICPECGEDSHEDCSSGKDKMIKCGSCGKESESSKWKKIDKSNNLESQSENENVKITDTQIIQKNMKLNNIKDITDDNLKESKASDINALFESEIKKISDDYINKLNAEKDALKNQENKYKELEAKFNKLQEDSNNVQNKLNELTESALKKEKEEIFASRMSYFDEKYELSKEDRDIIGGMIKDLDKDKYESASKNLEVLLSSKIKKIKETVASIKTEEVKEKEADKTVNSKEVLSEVIDKGEKVKNTAAATLTVTESLSEKMKKSFGLENWTTNIRKK